MRRFAWAITLSLLLSAVLFGQTTSLTGTVSDPSGAVIPAATITITSTATGSERTTVSDSQGRYTLPQVAPGKYKITAKVAGFSDVVIDNVELLVAQPATIPIVFEKLGSTTTTVQVESTAAQVNTTDASLGNAIGTQTITEMPMYARNVAGLLAFQPGVTSFGSFGAQNLDYRSGAVNGGKSDQGNITLDGADVNDQNSRQAFTTVLRVTLDSVEEFRSTTTNGDTATGRGSGADIVLVTKSGTNELHGSLYEYRRGTETAANSFFNNLSGVPVAPLLINVFGGSVGGPVKKNKLFYFLNYEGRRDRSAVTVTRTVPTETLKLGIVEYKDATTGGTVQVSPAQMKSSVDPLGIGPSSLALQALNLFPRGNDPQLSGVDNLNTTGYLFNAPGKSDQNTYIAKLDYKLDDAGKHSLFIRGNLQNDSADNGAANAPEFPGQPANSVSLADSKGLAAGWTGVLTPNLVSNFRYGYTRAGTENTGVLASNWEFFRGFSTPYGTSTGLARILPVHTLSQDFSWNHGAHDIRFGGIVRLVSNSSVSYSHSFSTATSNPSVLNGSGNDLIPSSFNVSGGTKTSYEYGAAAVLGLIASGTANYNYLVDGTLLPVGAPVNRDFVNHEGEMYVQDTWKVTRNFTVTAGVRISIEPPVYEANGQQASTNIPIGTWLNERGYLASVGQPDTAAGNITFIPANGPNGRPMYPFHTNTAPRLGLAYSPKAESGLSKFFFGGPGKTSIRAGAGMYYDVLGQPLAQTFNQTVFGLSTTLSTPPNQLSSAQVPRYNGFFTVPGQLVPAPGVGGLPPGGVTYPTSAFAITNSIDDQLKAPYTMNLDFSIGREFGHGIFIQGSYVGRLSRHSIVDRDLAMPANLTDPKSGQTYNQAYTQLANLLDYQHVSIANLPKIPFFENMWATAAGNGLSATQVWGTDYKTRSNPGDFTNTLSDADVGCNPGGTIFTATNGIKKMGCGIAGPFMIFAPQFSALSAGSSIGHGAYHAMQWTIRKHFSNGLQFDVNYTWSKSMDLGSAGEAGTCNPTCNPATATYTSFIINAWNPNQMYAVSDYDTTHQINAFVVYQLPFGRGRQFGSNMSKLLDAVVGGWQISGNYRQTSGLPFSVSDGSRWPTDWELSGSGVPNGNPIPAVTSAAGPNGPNLWGNSTVAAQALAAFNENMPGQSGSRNILRGSGLFNIDTGLSKTFTMPYSEHHKIQLRWESFNITNSVRFDPGSGASISMTNSTTFGNLSNQLGTPRQMQFAGRYSW